VHPSPYGSRLTEAIARDTGIVRRDLLDAFASIPRAPFLGPPPWLIARGPSDGASGPTYAETNDPEALYANVSVALDAERQLYNGAPGTMAV